MPQVSVRDCRDEDRRWIAGVYRQYLNDLAASATGLFPALPEYGHREPDQLQSGFADANTQMLTVLYGEQPVGFAKIKLLSARGTPVLGGGGGMGGVGRMASAGGGAGTRNTGSSSSSTGTGASRDGHGGEGPQFSMAEFFVAQSWRRRGIGAQAVRLILDRFTGRWLISELLRNDPAVRFWRRVVGTYTGGAYQESVVDGEVRQRFQSGVRRGAGV